MWYQNMLRYEAEVAPQPKPVPAPVPDDAYMLTAEQVAEKISALPKDVWQTSYDIQKALAPAPPHKMPFAAIKTINSVLYTMLNKTEAVKAFKPGSVDGRPIWKLV